jgi:hypothetical protein
MMAAMECGSRVVPALLVVLLTTASARATECRAIAGGSPALAAIDAETRLRWLDQRLAVDARRARIWAVTWGMFYGTVTIGELAIMTTQTTAGEKADNVAGAATAFIGLLSIAVIPLQIMPDQRWWEKHLKAHRGDDLCALVNTAEQLLVRDAQSEAFGVSPLIHVGNFVLNIAAGLALGLAYNRWAAFGYTTLLGIAVGELQAGTQPTDAVEDLRLYKRGELDARPRPPRLGDLALLPMLRSDGGGAMLLLRW